MLLDFSFKYSKKGRLYVRHEYTKQAINKNRWSYNYKTVQLKQSTLCY